MNIEKIQNAISAAADKAAEKKRIALLDVVLPQLDDDLREKYAVIELPILLQIQQIRLLRSIDTMLYRRE